MSVLLGTAATVAADDEVIPAGVFRKQADDARSPLQRLRERSARERWNRLKRQWVATENAETPAPPSVPAFPHVPPRTSSRDTEPAWTTPRPSAPIRSLPPLPDEATSRPLRATPARQVRPLEPRADVVRTPGQLQSITTILPYDDYEPDVTAETTDPCRNLCPRPLSGPCAQHLKPYLLPPAWPGKTQWPEAVARSITAAIAGGTANLTEPIRTGVEIAFLPVPKCPEELPLSDQPYQARALPESIFQWQASNLYHNPVYFGDPVLERYGHTRHPLVQPFISVGKFGVQLVGLPYQMTIDPPRKRQYVLGWYRPGDHVPHLRYQVPFNGVAATAEAGVLSGLFLIFP